MSKYKSLFKRKEIKFLIEEEQYNHLMERLVKYARIDNYGEVTLCNIYYDTPDFRLIRTSIEKPKYKEKIRIRSYNIPRENSNAFVEIKKKYRGVVYKRRVAMNYEEALREMREKQFICHDDSFDHGQISAEISYMLNYYKTLRPAMCIFYERIAMQGINDPILRITFDRNIRWRVHELDLRMGTYGINILDPGQRIMELKVQGSIPLYLCHILCELGIYKTSFSKYGRGYLNYMKLKKSIEETKKRSKETTKEIKHDERIV